MKLSKLNELPEIFFTIQGEGKSAGTPSVFIRLSLCNLYCVWCDTPYTWNWEGTDYKHESGKKYYKEEEITELDVDLVIRALKEYNCNNIVLTGGEPMIQHKELTPLMAELKKDNTNYRFEIETNGTIKPTIEFDELIDQYNVSPKLSNSGIEEKERIKRDVLGYFSGNEKANFKFVVKEDKDFTEILTIQNDHKISPRKIYIMPEGTTESRLKESEQTAWEGCLKYGFNYTPRLHINLFGSKRGV